MAKRFTGLDGLIAPTAPKNETEGTTTSPQQEKEVVKYVNSNVPLLEEHHLQLRIIAMKEGKTLKQLLPEIIGKWLEEYESKRK